MTSRGTFEELLKAAQACGIQVRHAPLGGTGGGLAQVKGKPCLFVDTDADPEDQLDRTLDALRGVATIRQQPLRADVRQLLEGK